jgi:hypothetical protein
MTRVRKNKGLLALLLVSMLLTTGCGSSSSNTSGINEPYEKQDISGVWLGYIGSTFTVGIFTKEDNDHFSGRLIGQDKHNQYKQFISPDESFLTQTTGSAVFTGYLEDCSWNTSGLDYSTVPLQSIYIIGTASTKRVFGSPIGAYNNRSNSETGTIVLYYNTTYDVPPNVNNISGQWEIHDALLKDNTIKLSITPYTADTKGAVISGLDDRGNTFNGTIEIYYSPLDNKPHNVYDVKLWLNNTINLSGLAAYVLESNTEGIIVSKKTLAIGATNEDRSYSFSGLAEFIK